MKSCYRRQYVSLSNFNRATFLTVVFNTFVASSSVLARLCVPVISILLFTFFFIFKKSKLEVHFTPALITKDTGTCIIQCENKLSGFNADGKR